MSSYRFAYKSYRLPLKAPLHTAHGVWTEREGAFVRVENEAGEVGFGEVAPMSWFGTETLAEAVEVLTHLHDRVDATDLEKISGRFGCVRFALAQAFGGGFSSVVAPVPKLAVAGLLPAGRTALDKVKLLLDEGWLAFKWKVGVGDPADELSILDDLLAQLPAYAKLRVDANGGWTRRQAVRWFERCADKPIEFIEQPVATAEIDTLLGLANDYSVTVALDESVTGLESLRAWIGRGWRGVFVIKPSLAGVPQELLDTLSKAKADVVFSTALETPLGMGQALRIAFHYANPQVRALGFGVASIFSDARFNHHPALPLLEASSYDGVKPDVLWDLL